MAGNPATWAEMLIARFPNRSKARFGNCSLMTNLITRMATKIMIRTSPADVAYAADHLLLIINWKWSSQAQLEESRISWEALFCRAWISLPRRGGADFYWYVTEGQTQYTFEIPKNILKIWDILDAKRR